MIRLLIADDEKLEREALAELVQRRFEREVVLEVAENGRKAADTAVLWGADLILMDIEMPGMSGLDAARAVLAQRPSCRVIFVTAYSLFQYAHEAVHLGACGLSAQAGGPDELEGLGAPGYAADRDGAEAGRAGRRPAPAGADGDRRRGGRRPPRRARTARRPLSWPTSAATSRITICSICRWTAWARSCTSARPTCRRSSRNTRR
mgnify:CR=1 FL=1